MISKGKELKKTPLNSVYHNMHARLADFCGYELPIWYTSIIEEHNSVRTNTGIFDISHMGRVYISGEGATDFLDYLLTKSVRYLEIGKAQLCLMCLENGGILDDLWVYRIEKEKYIIVWNACNAVEKRIWVQKHACPYPNIIITDRSSETTMMAVQGPLVPRLDILHDVAGLPRFHHAQVDISGIDCLVARTGYTGEDGYEIIINNDEAPSLWQTFLDRGVKSCGLGARDILRLEAGMLLYGQDMDRDTDPYEAGLGWLVDINSRNFIGKQALVKMKNKGVNRKLVGFRMVGKEIARHGYDIYKAGRHVGNVTSGGYSPKLGYNIGLGYVPKELSEIDTEIVIIIRSKPVKAYVVNRRFYSGRMR
jgi:aminomethyltransferase